MGKIGYDPEREKSAALTHELSRQAVRSPREECEAGDDAEAARVDELAERFRAEGASAGAAVRYALACREVFKRRDREACGFGGLTTGGAAVVEAGGVAEREIERLSAVMLARERVVEALAQIWAWPDARKGVGAMFFALGVPLYGCNSMRELAALRQVSVEDVSNVVDELQRILGVPRNAGQKSVAAVEAYRRENGAARRKAA